MTRRNPHHPEQTPKPIAKHPNSTNFFVDYKLSFQYILSSSCRLFLSADALFNSLPAERWVSLMKSLYYAATAAIALIALSTNALALTINFDPQGTPPGDLPSSINAMGNSPGSSVPDDAKLSNQYQADGVLFNSSAPFIAVVDIGSSTASPPNAIAGVTSGGLLSYADPITFTFVEPGTTTPGVTDSVSIQADSNGISTQFATLSAFDINGILLHSQTLSDVGSEVWDINAAGIHSVRFNFPTNSTGTPITGSAFGEGTGIALDNLDFGAVTAPTTPVTPVPLPPAASSALILLVSLAALRMLRRWTPVS
jgi:hypothetical protein